MGPITPTSIHTEHGCMSTVPVQKAVSVTKRARRDESKPYSGAVAQIRAAHDKHTTSTSPNTTGLKLPRSLTTATSNTEWLRTQAPSAICILPKDNASNPSPPTSRPSPASPPSSLTRASGVKPFEPTLRFVAMTVAHEKFSSRGGPRRRCVAQVVPCDVIVAGAAARIQAAAIGALTALPAEPHAAAALELVAGVGILFDRVTAARAYLDVWSLAQQL